MEIAIKSRVGGGECHETFVERGIKGFAAIPGIEVITVAGKRWGVSPKSRGKRGYGLT